MLYITIGLGFFVFITGVVCLRMDIIKEALLLILIGFIIMGLSFIAIEKIDQRISSYKMLSDTQEIVSFQDESKVYGEGKDNFIYVYVTIGTNGAYTYYYQFEDGGYRQKTLDADKTIIYESDDCEKPLVKIYSIYSRNDWSRFWTSILLFSERDGKYLGKTYEIYVPKGSVVQEFLQEG